MEIRQLQIEDKDKLEQLIHETESTLVDEKFWLPISETSRNHFFDKAWTILWGAFENEELIGSIGLFLNENEYGECQKYIHYEKKKIAEAGRVMCKPNLRQKGVASDLLKTLIDYSDSLDLDALIATVHPQNTPSQRLVKKFGFVKKDHIVKLNNYERDILIREK